MGFGRSLELYFIDGKPEGMLTAKVFNWTGHILKAPRIQIRAALARAEAQFTGVYLLLGEKDGQPLTYIGEGEEIGARIRDHDSRKDWWTDAVLITTSADDLNKAHAKYLESRLVEQARIAGVMALENGNTPPRSNLSEAGIANMEEFLDTLFIVLPALGISMFTSRRRPEAHRAPASAADYPRFTLKSTKYGLQAKAVLEGGEFVVLKGSTAQNAWVGAGSYNSSYNALHDQLIDTGILQRGESSATFTENYAFTSPSAAAAVILGRAANGRTEWSLEADGRTYKVWENEQLSQVMP